MVEKIKSNTSESYIIAEEIERSFRKTVVDKMYMDIEISYKRANGLALIFNVINNNKDCMCRLYYHFDKPKQTIELKLESYPEEYIKSSSRYRVDETSEIYEYLDNGTWIKDSCQPKSDINYDAIFDKLKEIILKQSGIVIG